jgi:aldehyde dehydrogenase (NAD+)
MTRLHITKTPKCYVGGAFIRSESGRIAELLDATGAFFANIPQCTRKDLRNAVEAAAKAGPGWAKRSAFNRGQILYRLAEMMEARGVELAESITLSGVSKAEASRSLPVRTQKSQPRSL